MIKLRELFYCIVSFITVMSDDSDLERLVVNLKFIL